MILMPYSQKQVFSFNPPFVFIRALTEKRFQWYCTPLCRYCFKIHDSSSVYNCFGVVSATMMQRTRSGRSDQREANKIFTLLRDQFQWVRRDVCCAPIPRYSILRIVPKPQAFTSTRATLGVWHDCGSDLNMKISQKSINLYQ